MSSMPMIAPGPISAGASGSVNTADPQQAGAQDAFEQLFVQLMQQIQAALEQGQVEPGLDGASLPQDGEGLPPELLVQLEEFAAQLAQPVDSAELQQALEQLQLDGVAPDQSRQLLQAALLLQDARSEPGVEPEPLSELLQQLRQSESVGAEAQDLADGRQTDNARSIDELLQLAQQLRQRAEAGKTVSSEPVESERNLTQPQVAATSQPALETEVSAQAPVSPPEGASVDKPGTISAAQTGSANVVAAASEAVAVQPDEAEVVSQQAVPAAAVASGAERAAEVSRGVSNVGSAERAAIASSESTKASEPSSQSVGTKADPAPAEGRSGRGDASPDGQRDGARDQGLARWTELRDSVVAQGQKLVQAENAFKNIMASQSTVVRQGESVSLAQVSSNASLNQLQQAYQGNAQSGIVLGLNERFGGERWNAAASQRIVWMAGQNVGHAELRLDPPELGSLNVRLNLHGEQASLSFTSPHAHVRDALEQQMPRLREMLAESGIELADSNVSDQPQAGASGDEGYRGENEDPDLNDLELASIADEQLAGARMSLSLVDYYA
ncbi:flagellar hook-length control protein FliK [Motiliproteus sp.]|uniref:flagellar hook-length control protein FliK n=1 Tax=Motiliproteus sp. TaxID=1898955 RepID=UPI003BA939C6